MKCPSCGKENSSSTVFCTNCGRQLGQPNVQVHYHSTPKKRKGKVWGWLLVAIAIIIFLSNIQNINAHKNSKHSYETQSINPTPTPTPQPQLEIINSEYSYSPFSQDYITGEADIQNNSDMTLCFIQIKVEIMNKNNNILDTDWTYAVGKEGLKPGAKAHFEIMFSAIDGAEKFKMSVMDYDW